MQWSATHRFLTNLLRSLSISLVFVVFCRDGVILFLSKKGSLPHSHQNQDLSSCSFQNMRKVLESFIKDNLKGIGIEYICESIHKQKISMMIAAKDLSFHFLKKGRR
jgi:uncharacterized membrane protein SpoIIM required for sporulation